MGKYFADVHEGPLSQLGTLPETVRDTEEIAELRRKSSLMSDKEGRYEALLALSKALIFQLRYKSALLCLDEAVSILPERNEALRMRAIRRLYTLDVSGSLEDFLLLRERNYGDLSYQIGLCRYLKGEYEEAMGEFEVCYGLSDDEMKMAAMYWQACSAIRCGGRAGLLDHYREDFECGHHTAYKAACAYFSGKLSAEELSALCGKEESDLDFAMLAYALHLGGRFDLKDIVKRDSFWIGFAYVAAWNDLEYDGRGRR